jgi:hypothetical protein
MKDVALQERLEFEVPLPTAEVTNRWTYTTIPPDVFMASCLIKHRGHLPENQSK